MRNQMSSGGAAVLSPPWPSRPEIPPATYRCGSPMHLAQIPIVLGRGVRAWDGLEALEED